MNSNVKEGRQQKIEHFKKQALLALTTAFRAPLMLMMGCGYVTVAKSFMGQRAEIHNHDGKKIVHTEEEDVPYNPKEHGEIVDFVEEGERVPGLSNSVNGKAPIHRHPGLFNSREFNGNGVYEYKYE